MSARFDDQLARLQKYSFGGGIIGLALCGAGAAANPRQLLPSWLLAYTFWLGLTLGCLGVAMMHHLSGGRWGFVVRRFLEAGFLTLPVMALLFLPIILGRRYLYPWVRPEALAVSPILQHQQSYLNTAGFACRAALFFAIWIGMAACLRRWSVEQDRNNSPAPTIRLRTLSGPGIVLYPLTGTFAFVDWVMSIEPEWYSTIFPLIVLIGQVLSAFAFLTVVLAWAARDEPFQHVVTPQHFHDLGNLLLTFVIFWTYLAFSQLLIIYSGNLPHEIRWYLHRSAGDWKWLVLGLATFQFFVPFFLLLSRTLKRNVRRLALVAGLVFAGQIVADFWTIAPAFHPTGLYVHWLDLAALLGVGGVWLAAFARTLRQASLLPLHDPRAEYPNNALSPYAH